MGTHFLPQGQDTWQGIALMMKECHGLLLGLGIARKASILILVLFHLYTCSKNHTSQCNEQILLSSMSPPPRGLRWSYVDFLTKKKKEKEKENALSKEKPRFLSAQTSYC